MNFPKRYIAHGMSTTRRVVRIERTPDSNVYRILTAWAGNHTPEDRGWRATVVDGVVTLSGIPEWETPQVRAGIVRRVKAAEARR